MKQYYSLGLLLFLFSFIACDKDELKAPIPAYLVVNQIQVQTTPAQGSSSSNIKDIVVYINDQSLGFFELPANIPIQQTGPVNLKIRGVIRVDGQANDKKVYPFYTTYDLDTILVPEVEMRLQPVVGYFSNLDFDEPWSGEDFESGVNFMPKPLNDRSDTFLIRELNPSEVFEGVASGLGILEAEDDFFETLTPTFSNIPRDGTAVYLELNYKSTHTFIVSIYANNQSYQSPIVYFRPRDTWTKVYVDMGSVFSILSVASDYNIAFGYQKSVGEAGRLMLDNVKLIHY